MATTVKARPVLLVALAAVLAVGAASLALRPRGAPVGTLTGRTAAGAPVVVTLRDGRVTRFLAGSAALRCESGWRLTAPSVSGAATESDGRVSGSGLRRISYPDGEPGLAASARLDGSQTSAQAVVGTLAYAVTLHGARGSASRCVAGPVRFAAGRSASP